MDVVRYVPEIVGECVHIGQDQVSVPRLAETQAKKKLERVFENVMGIFRAESLLGFRFCIVFADQYINFVFVDLLKAKNESMACLKKFLLSVGMPKKQRQDHAKEFISEQFKMHA